MMDPAEALLAYSEGQAVEWVPHLKLRACEEALGLGHPILADLRTDLVPAEAAFLRFREAQLANDASSAGELLGEALTCSRSQEGRDHLLEARIRMEWGVLRSSTDDVEQAGVDLKWAMERFAALEDGHPWHGLSILNLARWHDHRSEPLMALALLASISRHSVHPVEIIALSRRHAAELLIGQDDMPSALRHLWVAYMGFAQTGMADQAVEAGLHWLDLALFEIDENAPTMEQTVAEVTPRSFEAPRRTFHAHPDDIRWMLDQLVPVLFENPEGDSREDLVLLAEAASMVEHTAGIAAAKSTAVQDPNVRAVLQS